MASIIDMVCDDAKYTLWADPLTSMPNTPFNKTTSPIQEEPSERYLRPSMGFYKAELRHSVCLGMTTTDTINLSGACTAKNGIGKGELTASWRKFLFPRFRDTWLDIQVNIGRHRWEFLSYYRLYTRVFKLRFIPSNLSVRPFFLYSLLRSNLSLLFSFQSFILYFCRFSLSFFNFFF